MALSARRSSRAGRGAAAGLSTGFGHVQILGLALIAALVLFAPSVSHSIFSKRSTPAVRLLASQAGASHSETDSHSHEDDDNGTDDLLPGGEHHGDDHGGDHHGGTHLSGAFYPVIFFLFTYFLSAVSQTVVTLFPEWCRLPHSVVLFLLGAAWTSIGVDTEADSSEFGKAVASFTDVDPHVVFWVLLPALLYEDAAGSQWHVIQRVLPSALLLAGPGVIINTVLTGVFIRFVMNDWEWEPAMLLGSMLSATDPVAVVGSLHALGAPAKLSSLISGEALFNDGTAVALFQIFLEVASGEREFDILYSIGKLCKLALGGPLLGLVFALVAFTWLRGTRNFQVEILVIVIAVYGSFFVAEHEEVEVSGVLAVVAFGFFMTALGHFALDIEKEHDHHAIINFLALLSNEAIFVIAGAVGYKFLIVQDHIEMRDWLDLLMLYVAVHGTRFLVILLGWPLLTHMGYGMSWKEAIICVHGGLRGAVGLALALFVQMEDGMSEATRAKIAFHTSGIVLGTLILNATTISKVYKSLQIYHTSHEDQHFRLLKLGLQRADALIAARLRCYKEHWFFHNCDLDIVAQLVPNLKKAAQDQKKNHYGRRTYEALAKKHISEAMMQLAGRIGEPNPNRLVQKLKMSHRKSWATNPFLLRTTTPDWEDVGIEMALGLARKAAKGGKKSEIFEQLEHSLGDDVDESQMTPALRARRRWHRAMCLARAANMQLEKYRSRREHFVKQVNNMDHVPVSLERIGSPTVRVNMLKSKARDNLNSFDILLETYQTIVNATRADFRAMEEHRSISDAPYDILMLAMDYMQEAISGDLKWHPFLADDGLAGITIRNGKPADKFAETQLKACVDVSWACVRSWIGYPRSRILRFADRFLNGKSLFLKYRVLKRDMELVLAYAMTADHIIEEMEHLEHILASWDVMSPLRRCREKAKAEGLQEIYQRSPQMFIIFEHILCARLMVRLQCQLVKCLAEEGALGEDDYRKVVSELLEPTEDALASFVPYCAHLKAMGCKASKPSSRIDRILKFIVRYVSVSPGVR